MPSAGDAGLTQLGPALLGSLRLGGKLLSQSLGVAQQWGEGQGPREGGGAPGSQRRASLDGPGRMGGFQEVLRKTGGLAEKGQCGWSSGIAILCH